MPSTFYIFTLLFHFPFDDFSVKLLSSATVEDSKPSEIVLVFSGATGTTAPPAQGWTYSVNGGAAVTPTATLVGSVLTLTTTVPLLGTDSITLSYTNAVSAMTVGGTPLGLIVGKSVKNNIVIVSKPVKTMNGLTLLTSTGAAVTIEVPTP